MVAANFHASAILSRHRQNKNRSKSLTTLQCLANPLLRNPPHRLWMALLRTFHCIEPSFRYRLWWLRVIQSTICFSRPSQHNRRVLPL